MVQRAEIAHLEDEERDGPPTGSSRGFVSDPGEEDTRRTTLDPPDDDTATAAHQSDWKSTVPRDDEGADDKGADDEEIFADVDDVELIVTPPPSQSPLTPLIPTPRPSKARKTPAPPAPPSAPDSEKRRKAAASTSAPDLDPKSSAWDDVERLFRAQEEWGDLVEMYIQRAEGTGSVDVKGSLFRRIGHVLQDELDDPQQALDAFVEALHHDPGDADAKRAIHGIASDRGWWSELLTTLLREVSDVGEIENDKPRAIARCELAMLWVEAELGDPSRAEPFLDPIRSLDPGHPAVHRKLASFYEGNSAWGSQRESLERALLRARSDDERRSLHLLLGRLNEQRFQDYAEATKHYDAVLEIDPCAIPALEGMERIFRTENRFPELIGVLERQAEATGDDDARVEVLVRLADLHEHHFVKPQAAIGVLERALRLHPRHEATLAALERCYHATRAWKALVKILELRVRTSDRASEQNALIARIAEVLELKIVVPEAGAIAWQRVWDQVPSSERALSELARLAERGWDLPAAAAYRSKLADLARPAPRRRPRSTWASPRCWRRTIATPSWRAATTRRLRRSTRRRRKPGKRSRRRRGVRGTPSAPRSSSRSGRRAPTRPE